MSNTEQEGTEQVLQHNNKQESNHIKFSKSRSRETKFNQVRACLLTLCAKFEYHCLNIVQDNIKLQVTKCQDAVLTLSKDQGNRTGND